ncbi:MAG: hypothetical protein WCR33_04825, partial [Bacilli bacterium]
MKQKRIFLGILVLFLAFGLFGCKNTEKQDNVDAAADAIKATYASYPTVYLDDFERLASIEFQGTQYTITWTVEVTSGVENGVTIGDVADGNVTIVIGEKLAEDTTFVLTAKLTDEDDYSATVEFRTYTTPEYAVLSWQEYSDAETDAAIIIEGVLTAVSPYSADYKNITFTMQDADGGYYCYRVTVPTEEAYNADFVIGNTIQVSATRASYSGLNETGAGGTYKVISTETQTVDAEDITAAIVAGNDLTAKQAMKVKVIGATIISYDADSSVATASVSGVEFKISVSKYILDADEMVAAAAKLVVGSKLDIEGVVGWYSKFQLMVLGADAITTSTAEVTTQEKATASTLEAAALVGTDTFLEETTIALPTAGVNYTEAALTYAVTGDALALTDGALVITPQDEDSTNTLTITATIGEVTATKELTIEVGSSVLVANTHAEYVAAEKDTALIMQGVVTAVGPFNDTYNSLTFTMQDADGGYYCYGVKADSAEQAAIDLALGNTIMVFAEKGSYEGLNETNSNGTYKVISTETQTIVSEDITAAITAGDDLTAKQAMQVKVVGTTVKSVDSSDATRVSAVLTVGEKDFAVSVSKYILTTDEMAAVTAKLVVGATLDIEGIVGWYNGFQLMPLGADFVTTQVLDKTDAEKADLALAEAVAAISTTYGQAAEVTLPIVATLYPDDTTLTYAVTGDALALAVNVLTVTPQAAEAACTVEITATCGEETKTQTVDVTVAMVISLMSHAEFLAAETGDVVRVQGVIVETGSLSEDHIRVALQDDDGGYYCYALKCASQDAADTDLVKGYTIEVIGTRG